MIYQILGWDSHFENNRSRQVEKCNFVCVPNKQSGMGFRRLLREPDGMAIYGLWHCILGACSQQQVGVGDGKQWRSLRDGWLTDNGRADGVAWTEEDLSVKFGRPEEEIKRALSVLSSVKIGWVAAHEQVPKDYHPPIG